MFSVLRTEKHLCLWNSSYRSNQKQNNANCQVYFKNHHWLQNTIGFGVKSITLTHLFPNIYGYNSQLYIGFGGIVRIDIPAQNIVNTAALDAILQPLLQTAVGGTVTVVTDAAGIMTITSTNPFTILTPQQVFSLYGQPTSMNTLLGHDNNSALMATPYTFTQPVNLMGVRKVRVGSSIAASSRSVHPNGDNGDIITSLSLHDVDYGFSKTYEYDTSDNAKSVFREPRDCAGIGVELYDEYDQILSLPDSAHVDLEFIVTSRTS